MSGDLLLSIFGSGRLGSGDSSSEGTMELAKKSQDGSCDLFSNQSSQDSKINEQIDITLQLTESVWVQCDNPQCQKWRRVPATEADSFGDDPWYCHMSSDSLRNTCLSPEEDHAMYDRMAKKAGIKFVMSMLNVGSLVWAKMAGYCRWPAVITRDPDLGVHVLVDIDGDPHSYHVEFLGKPHSHSWVAAKCVEVYGHKLDSTSLSEDNISQPGSQKPSKVYKGRRRAHGKKTTPVSQGKIRKSYKKMHIAKVIQEADFLLELPTEERLTYTVFRFDPEKQEKREKKEAKRSTSSSCEKCSQCKKKKKTENDKASSMQQTLLNTPNKPMKQVLKNHIRQKRRVKKQSILNKGKENAAREMYDYHSDESCRSNLQNDLSLDEGISVKTVKTDPSMFGLDSPDQFSQSKLKFTNTMVDKSKEEKFSIDIDMYRKNEKAFEHDVRRFMSRNGKTIRNTPVWHTVPIRLFQLYLAVHERGGYLQVTKDKQWTAVYKELTEQHNSTSGVVAKNYYENNLYPYELYITGKDYVKILCKRKKQLKTRQPKMANIGVEAPTANKKKMETIIFNDGKDGSTFSQDIEAILVELEEDDASQKSKEKTRKRGIKFHDDTTESPSITAKVPSEFQPTSTLDGAQEVPEDKLSEGLSDIEEKILHEMKALEDDMKQLDEIDEV